MEQRDGQDRPAAGPAVGIRPATVGDVEAMLAIYAPIVLETPISFELEPPTVDEFAARLAAVSAVDPWLVAEVDGGADGDERGVAGGQVAGYAYAGDFRSRPAYGATRETTVYVAPWAHGLGVGTALMTALLDDLTARGVAQVIAGIVPPNPASVALHERLGYRYVGTFTAVGNKFGQWHDLGFWQRALDGDG